MNVVPWTAPLSIRNASTRGGAEAGGRLPPTREQTLPSLLSTTNHHHHPSSPPSFSFLLLSLRLDVAVCDEPDSDPVWDDRDRRVGSDACLLNLGQSLHACSLPVSHELSSTVGRM